MGWNLNSARDWCPAIIYTHWQFFNELLVLWFLNDCFLLSGMLFQFYFTTDIMNKIAYLTFHEPFSYINFRYSKLSLILVRAPYSAIIIFYDYFCLKLPFNNNTIFTSQELSVTYTFLQIVVISSCQYLNILYLIWVLKPL